ncbi:hypothetical protein D3C71_1200470 [compost metagenome]
MILAEFQGTFEHFIMNLLEHCLYLFNKVLLLNYLLLTCDTGYDNANAILHIAWSKLQAHRYTAHFIFIELPTWRYIRTIIHTYTNTCVLQLLEQLVCPSNHGFASFRRSDRNHNHLSWRYLRWQNKTTVITMHHNQRTNQACSGSP